MLPAQRLLRGLVSNPASILGTVLLLGFVLVALFAPVLAPCPQDKQRFCDKRKQEPDRPGARRPIGRAWFIRFG